MTIILVICLPQCSPQLWPLIWIVNALLMHNCDALPRAIVVQTQFGVWQRSVSMASQIGQPPAKKSRLTETKSRLTETTSRLTETSMAERRSKILGVVNTKGCSLEALLHITNKLAKDGEETSRRALHDIAHERFQQVRRTIALPLADGGEHLWEVADPNLLVAHTVRCSGDMQELFGNALRRHPCSPEQPWRLLVTWDEFTPGSLLRPQNQRKAMVVNISFQELGAALHNDNCWWTIAVARTKVMGQVVGGWSRMLRDLLKLTLCSPTGIQIVGLPLEIKGELATIYAKVGCLLSDGDGLRIALQWMGSGSLHPCFRHWNVLKKNSDRAHHCSSGTYVEIDCHDATKFKCWSTADLATTIDVCTEAEQQYAAGGLFELASRISKGVWGFVPQRMASLQTQSFGGTSTSWQRSATIGPTHSYPMASWAPRCGHWWQQGRGTISSRKIPSMTS